MSLLEDVFLEDEAGEAQELERIIEGDEYDDRPRPSTPNSNDNSEKEDEAEEDKRHVDPTSAKPKRIVKNPRVILNPARLTGPRGIQVIPEHFKDFTFKGKGHEKEDLDLVLKKLEHWAYRLFPKFAFKDCLKKMETLGNKRPVMVHLTKIRTDQFMSEDTVVQRDSSEDEGAPEPVEDEFDKLLQQQIDLARATPAPGAVNKGFSTPTDRSVTMPKATSSPSINDEQRERMIRNRQLAEERRLARLKLNNSDTGLDNAKTNIRHKDSSNDTLNEDSRDNNVSKDNINVNSVEKHATNAMTTEDGNADDIEVMQDVEANIIRVRSNRSNVIDSSDSEDDGLVINESVTVDVHNHGNNSNASSDMDYQNRKKQNVDHNGVMQDVEENIVRNSDDSGEDDGLIISESVIDRHNHRNYSYESSDTGDQNKQYREVNSDKIEKKSDHVYQNDNDQRYLDIDHENDDREINSDINQQNEIERHSEMDQNKNVEKVRINNNDVEMNDNTNLNESMYISAKFTSIDKSDTNAEHEEITITKEDSKTIQSNDTSTAITEQKSKNDNNLKNVDQTTENIEKADTNNETAIDVDDIMDVDFSDDF